MDEKELKEIFEFLQGAGANPQLCDTEVPYFEASVRAGLLDGSLFQYRALLGCSQFEIVILRHKAT